MSQETNLSDIAKILNLIATEPNSRLDPQGTFGKRVFDGGTVQVQTGTTVWEFTNGVKAYSGTLGYSNFVIYFPDGTRVEITNKSPA